MAKEIERKFLVKNDSYREQACRVRSISQGYISTDPDRTVRVRVVDGRGFLTVKTRNIGPVRNEWEFEIPADDATEMLKICVGRVISKNRYIVEQEGMTWEVDEFLGDLSPLVVAEIELPAADTSFALPSFAGEEVTDNPRYFNSVLSAQV